MANSYVRVAPDSTGKYVQTFSNTVGATLVEANAVALVDEFGVPIGTATAPLSVVDRDATVSGSITTTDSVVTAPAGDGTFRTGTSTSTSYVAIACPGGDSAWNLAITGTWTGALYFEGSPDSTNGINGNWVNINGRQTGIVNTVLSGNTTVNGMYRGNTSGLTYYRVRAVGSWTGTATIRINITSGVGAVFLNASVPAGTNTIGSVNALRPNTNITGAITTTDLVVAAPANDTVLRSGTSTANSYVSVACPSGDATWTVSTTGTWTGTLYFEGSADSSNGIDGTWAAVNGRAGAFFTTSVNYSTTTNMLYQGNAAGFTYFRVRAVGAWTGSATVRINISFGSGYSILTTSLPAGSNSIGTVQPPAITKGTQGAVGFTTQDLKDAGRNQTNYHMTLPILTTASDVLMSLTGYKGGAAVAATTTPAVVTAGKTYRISAISITYVATATAGLVRASLRANTAGVVAVGSPVVAAWVVGAGTPATAGSSQTEVIHFPDGMEFAAGTGVGITIVGVSATGAAAVAGYGQVALTGYEY